MTEERYGHADWDTPRNPQREQQMSEERAREVTNWLKSYVRGSIPTPIAWDSNASHIEWDTKGFGATQLIASPTSEANRAKNRRVKILLASSPSRPNCVSIACPEGSNVAQKRLSFQEMWWMIFTHYYCDLPNICKCNNNKCCIPKEQLRDIFSPELLIAIFWEESKFCNGRQDGGRTSGFGQVEKSGRELGCSFCKICGGTSGESPWERKDILCDDRKSVQITGMYLWHLFCHSYVNSTQKDNAKREEEAKCSALRGYVGHDPKNKHLANFTGTDKEWQKCRQAIINGWLACEKHLQSRSSDFVSKDFVVEALKKINQVDIKSNPTTCKINSAYSEAMYNDILFPPGSGSLHLYKNLCLDPTNPY